MLPRNLYTRALEDFGMDVSLVHRVLSQKYGTGEGLSEPEAYLALEEHYQLRGGAISQRAEDPTAMTEIMGGPVARHMAKAAGVPLEPGQAPPPGYIQWQEWAYPPEAMGYSLGYNVEAGRITMGAPLEKVKYWRQAGQQGPTAWFEDLPVEQSGILAQRAQVPEPIQRVQAFLSVGPVGPEGTHYFDPSLGRQRIPFTERIMLPQDLDPTTLSLQAGMQIPTSGEPLSLFPGHTGIAAPRFQAAELTHWDIAGREVGGREYNELILQGMGYFPRGAPHEQKFAVKGGSVPFPGLEAGMGVQYLAPVRDPMLAVAGVVHAMTPAQRTQTFGREIERWTPGLYQEALKKVVIPGLQERWMPPQTFQVDDPITQQLLTQGALRGIQPVGEPPIGARVDLSDPFRTGAIRAERRVVGFEAPFGIQPKAPWLWHQDVIGRETMADVRRVHGEELYEHLQAIAAPRRATLEQVGGAYLANVSPQAQFMSRPAGEIGWESAYGSVIEQLAERGIDPSQAQPGLVGQMLMRAVGARPELKGRGIAFPVPGGGQTVMPNPAAIERWGGQTPVEGMPWGFFKRYAGLMQAYMQYQQAPGSDVTATYGRKLQEAFGAEKGSLSEITGSAAFSKAVFGGMPIGGARMGGRFAPLEDLPINRWFTGTKLLTQYLAPHVARGVDPAGLAKRMIMGEKVGPRAAIWREPLTMPEEQLKIVLGFMSYTELAERMPGLTLEQYEILGQAVRVHPIIAPTQGGDWDWDPHTGTIVSRYSETGMAHLAQLASPEYIRGLAARHPAGEIESLRQKMARVTTVEQAAQFFREAPQTHAIEDVAAQFGQRATAAAQIGQTYSAFRRRLAGAVRGEGELAVRARSELGVPFMAAQEMGIPTGPAAEIQNLVMRLSAAKFGMMRTGADPENITEGDLGNLWNPRYAMPYAFRTVAQWEEVSPETRAVLLGGAGDPGRVRELAGAIGAFTGAESMKGRTAAMEQMMQLATGQERPTWEQWSKVSPLGQVMYEGAAYRGMKRGDWVPGTEMERLARRGAGRQAQMETYYKGERGRRPLEETVARLETAVAEGVMQPEEADAIRRSLLGMQYGMGVDVTEGTAGAAAGTIAEDITASAAETTGMLYRAREFAQGTRQPPAPPPGGPPGAPGSTGQPPRGGGPPRMGFDLPIPEGFRGQGWTKFSGTPEEGYRVSGGIRPQMGLEPRQQAIITAMGTYEKALGARAAQLNEAIEAGRALTKGEQKYTRILDDWSRQMRIGAQVATQEEMGGVQEAQGMLEGWGAQRIGAYGAVQAELGAAGITGGGGPGRLDQFAGGLRRLAVGWTPFQMRRMWQMTGAPVFNQMIPAAAQAEAAGWQLAQGMGAPMGGMPEGVAGGVMQYQAAQRQALVSGGRAGFRAWGAGMPAIQGLREAQGIFGPALGAGGAAAIGAFALGVGGTAAMGVGAAVAAPLAAYGALSYIRSFGEPTAENALTMWQPGAQPIVGAGLEGLLRPGGLRQGWQVGVMEAGYALRAPEAGQMYPGIPGAPPPVSVNYAQQMERRAFQIAQTPIGQLDTQDRMAALNRAAQEMGAEGTVWAGMDEGQRLSALRRFAPYAPEIGQLSTEGLIAQAQQPDWWVSQAISAGIDTSQFEGLAGQMQMGPTGATWLTQQALQQPGDVARRSWAMGLQQFAPLTRFGFGAEQISEFAQGGMLTGQQGVQFQRLLGGDRYAWSEQARAGQAPGWTRTMEGGGLPVGTTTMTGLLGLSPAARMNAPDAMWQRGGGQVSLMGGATADIGYGGAWGAQDWGTAEQREYQDVQMGQQWTGLIAGGLYQRRRWRLQDRTQAGQDIYQRQQFGFQAEGLALGGQQFWERMALQEQMLGVQQEQAGADILRGYQRGLTRLGWQEADLATQTGRGRTQFGWQAQDLATQFTQQQQAFGWQETALARQGVRAGTQFGWQMADIATGWGRQQQAFGWQAQDIGRGWAQQQTQFGWAAEDLGQRRAVSSLQFGWQMEDYEENIRFAVGRGRRRMMTQQERAVTMRNIEVGRMGTEEERMEQRERWAGEEHRITLERFEERKQQAEEDHAKQLERAEERRQWWEEDHATSLEQLAERRRWFEESHERDEGRLAERRQWLEEDFETQQSRLDTRRQWLKEDYSRELERNEQQSTWAEERLELQKKHHEEDMDLSERRLEAAKAHFEDQVGYREQLKALDRSKWEDDHRRAIEALAAAEEHRDIMRNVENLQREIARGQQKQIATWNKFWAEGGEFQAVFAQILEGLQDLSNRLAIH